MNLEITPDPTDEERAAIAAALADDAEARPRPWNPGDVENCEEIDNP